MKNTSVKKLVFVYSLREAHSYVVEQTKNYDDDEGYANAVLSLINDAIMHDMMGGGVDEVIDILMSVGISSDVALTISSGAIDLIINELTKVVPDFEHRRYGIHYSYILRDNHDVVLTIDAEAYA